MFSAFDESTHTFLATYLIHPDGTGREDLPLPGPEGGGRWSHSGAEIAVMTVLDDGRIGTAIIRPDGTVDRVLGIPDPTLNAPCTVWSPDDSRLACEAWDETDPSRGGVYSVSSEDGGDLVRHTEAPVGSNDQPGDYSPDGTQLVFSSRTDEDAAPLSLLDLASGQARPLGSIAFEDSGRFTLDGELILTSAGGELVLVDLSGTEAGRITDLDAFLFGAVWSPDGEWIAFSRSEGGFIADIYVSRPDGSERWQVTDTGENEIAVDWGAEAD